MSGTRHSQAVDRIASAYIAGSRRREAGIFEAPPAMLKAVEEWMLGAYAGHVLAAVDARLEGATNATRSLVDARREMMSIRGNLARDVGKLDTFGAVLRLPVVRPKVTSLERTWVGIRTSPDVYRKAGMNTMPWDTKVGDPIPKDGTPLYEVTQSAKRIVFSGYPLITDPDKVLRWAYDVYDRAIGLLDLRIEQLAGKSTGATDTSIVELHLVRRECLKYTTKAKRYTTKASTTFPVDLTGWKYLRGSPLVNKVNKKIDLHNKALAEQIAEAKVDLKRAEVYATQLKRHTDQDAQNKARDELTGLFWAAYKVEQYVRNGQKMEAMVRRGPFRDVWVPVDKAALEFKALVGPDDLVGALADIGWRKITVFLDFKGHQKRGGQWRPLERELEVDAPPLGYTTLKGIQTAISAIRDTVRHEMQHCGQDLLRELVGSTEDAGLPSASIRDPKYDPSGDPRGRGNKRQEHALRDVEFYPRLADEVVEFIQYSLGIPKKSWGMAAKKWVGGSEKHFFGALRKSAPDKWKKAVAEFFKGVEKKLGPLDVPGVRHQAVDRLVALHYGKQAGWFRDFWAKVKSKKNDIMRRLRQEVVETKELGPIIRKIMTGQPVSDAERRAAKEQVADILKLVVIGASQAVPVPGASLVFPAIVTTVNKVLGKNFQWKPSAFRTAADATSLLMDALLSELSKQMSTGASI